MDNTTIISTVSIVISIIGTIILAVNHKRCRSRCGERTIVASFEVDTITPPSKIISPPIKNIIVPVDVETS